MFKITIKRHYGSKPKGVLYTNAIRVKRYATI